VTDEDYVSPLNFSLVGFRILVKLKSGVGKQRIQQHSTTQITKRISLDITVCLVRLPHYYPIPLLSSPLSVVCGVMMILAFG
jgi:hypothetical protein